MNKRNGAWLLVAVVLAVGIAIGYGVGRAKYATQWAEFSVQAELVEGQVPYLANELHMLEQALAQKGIIEPGNLDGSRNVMFAEPDVFSISHYVTEMVKEVQGIP